MYVRRYDLDARHIVPCECGGEPFGNSNYVQYVYLTPHRLPISDAPLHPRVGDIIRGWHAIKCRTKCKDGVVNVDGVIHWKTRKCVTQQRFK